MLSVVVITKNEQDRLATCLESVKWVDEIVIFDNGSTDKTLQIAKKYTDKIFVAKTDDLADLRNQAFKKTTGDWVLYIDADERVLDSLKHEIGKIITNSNSKSAYAISRKNIIFGHQVQYGPYQHDWVIRLLRRINFQTWVGKIHEYAQFTGELGYTEHAFLHLTHRNVDHFVLKSLEWSKIDAQLRLESGHPKMTEWRFIRILITELYNQTINRKGLFGGTVGIIDSILQVFFFYITYVRLWELQQANPLDHVYQTIDDQLMESGFKYS